MTGCVVAAVPFALTSALVAADGPMCGACIGGGALVLWLAIWSTRLLGVIEAAVLALMAAIVVALAFTAVVGRHRHQHPAQASPDEADGGRAPSSLGPTKDRHFP